jgi:hypothetical protein
MEKIKELNFVKFERMISQQIVGKNRKLLGELVEMFLLKKSKAEGRKVSKLQTLDIPELLNLMYYHEIIKAGNPDSYAAHYAVMIDFVNGFNASK